MSHRFGLQGCENRKASSLRLSRAILPVAAGIPANPDAAQFQYALVRRYRKAQISPFAVTVS